MTHARPRILLVDDEEYMREPVAEVLNDVGLQCVTVSNADDAAEALQREEFDLVLLDINMPGKSGMEFLPEIRTQYPDVAVVMLSGIDNISTGVEAMRKGAYDYLSKPVVEPELTTRIENALRRRDLILENKAYREKLELMVDELTLALNMQRSELTMLTELYDSYNAESLHTSEAPIKLQSALSGLSSVLEKLTSVVRNTGLNDTNASTE